MTDNRYRGIQMTRIIQVAILIDKHPGRWSRLALAKHLGVHKTTIGRDVKILREIGIEIDVDTKYGYRMPIPFLSRIQELAAKPSEKEKKNVRTF